MRAASHQVPDRWQVRVDQRTTSALLRELDSEAARIRSIVKMRQPQSTSVCADLVLGQDILSKGFRRLMGNWHEDGIGGVGSVTAYATTG